MQIINQLNQTEKMQGFNNLRNMENYHLTLASKYIIFSYLE